MAVRGDEGRGKAAISFGKLFNKLLSRRFPNGVTPLSEMVGTAY